MPEPAHQESAADLLADLPEPTRLALVHAPSQLRDQLTAFLALDHVLLRTAVQPRDPALTQLRLAWWRDQLSQAIAAGEAAHPVLASVASVFHLPFVSGTSLVDAWEIYAVGDDAVAGAEAVASSRAQGLHAVAGGSAEAVGKAVVCWTFVELAALVEGVEIRERLLASARTGKVPRLPRSQRSLAILAGLAQRAARRGQAGLLGDRLSPLAAIRLGIFGR